MRKQLARLSLNCQSISLPERFFRPVGWTKHAFLRGHGQLASGSFAVLRSLQLPGVRAQSGRKIDCQSFPLKVCLFYADRCHPAYWTRFIWNSRSALTPVCPDENLGTRTGADSKGFVRPNQLEVYRKMSKQPVKHPDKSANTGAYSAAVACDGWLYVSGHASLDLKTGQVIGGSIEEETSVTLIVDGKSIERGWM